MKRMLLTLATLAALAPATSSAITPRIVVSPHTRGPGIRLWTSGGEIYRRHERVRVYFRAEQDAFVLILRVDTDGRLQVLFPRRPDEDNFVYGGRTYTATNYGRDAFYVDDYPGLGYVFGVAANDPFDLEQLTDRDRWDIRLVADGRVHSDPYGELHDLVARLLPADYSDYDTHLLPYHVERRYDYPRFVCYDCHAYVGWNYWDPYRYWCSRYTLVVYNDPFYYYPSYWYPTRYYGGTRVVYVRPGQRDGRFVFRARENTAPAIEYRDRRTSGATATAERRPAERGVRGSDIGGFGSVAVPGRRTTGGEPGVVRQTPRDDRTPVVGGGRRPSEAGRRPTADQGQLQPRSPAEPSGETRRRVNENPVTVQPPSARSQPERRPSENVAPRDNRPESPKPEGYRGTTYRRPAAATAPSGRTAPDRPQAGSPRRGESSGRASEPRAASPQPRRETPRASPQPRSEPRAQPSQPSSRSSGGQSGGLVRRRPE